MPLKLLKRIKRQIKKDNYILCGKCKKNRFQFTFAQGEFLCLCGECFFDMVKVYKVSRLKVPYYMVQVDFEYMKDNFGYYTTKITEAARLRMDDYWAMYHALENTGVRGRLVETSYKPAGTTFLDPLEWKLKRELFLLESA